MPICPNCGADASGKFCSNCGSTLKGMTCANCQAEMVGGAKFCHRCGAPAGAASGAVAASAAAPRPKKAAKADAPTSPAANSLAAAAPWMVAGIALVALIALVVSYRMKGGDDAGAASAGGGDQQQAAAPFAGGAAGSASGVDISNMSPRERAERLYNRIMRLDTEGKKDSVVFFSTMAIQAYQMIPDQDADTRYDMGRIAQIAGAYPVAKAQVDTILATQPNNLLGLTLGMRLARQQGNAKDAAMYGKRLIAAAPAERNKDLPGYQLHKADLDQALKEAGK
jgi:hypothetical protein